MPTTRDGPLPTLLSRVGAFDDLSTLKPAAGLVPYDLNVPFWSDGAEKRRWIALPAAVKIHFSPVGEWTFPPGTVFVKHFELPAGDGPGNPRRRLETRVLVCDAAGGVYGASYKWRADGSDADLVTEPATERVTAPTSAGAEPRDWYFPGRGDDCLACHT